MTHSTERIVIVARWGALACALLLAGRVPSAKVAAGAAVLLAFELCGFFAPGARQVRTVWWVAAVLPTVVVSLTGGWSSPLLPCVLPPVLTVGLAYGFRRGALLAGVTTVLASGFRPTGEGGAWFAELVLVALLAAHARRLEQGAARVHDLEEANRLLTELHGIALTLSVSFEVDEVVSAASEQMRTLLHADAVGIDLDAAGGVAFTVERTEPLSARERSLLDEATIQTTLAVDNARRFSHLRTIGAHQERNRIARELHDQFGQDLATLGYMVDMLAASAPPPLADGLGELRHAVGYVVRGLRDALADLRSDVDPDHDLPSTLADFLARVEARSSLQTSLESTGTRRLPAVLERELLRIAEEAVTNAERHAHARHVSVRFGATEHNAVLEVSDDGIGLPVETPDRRFGLVGMRERAEAIGADLEIESHAGLGTTVRCRVAA